MMHRIGVAVLFVLGCSNTDQARRKPTAPREFDATCVVSRISDGDSFSCRGGLRVRLLLIDTPELDQGRIGTEAAEYLQRLAPPGTKLGLEFDVRRRDPNGRTLAYAWRDSTTMLNESLLRAGLALVEVYPPNLRYVDRFRAIKDSAQRARRGLWATDAFSCTPRNHRAGRC